jgi:restriction system protein
MRKRDCLSAVVPAKAGTHNYLVKASLRRRKNESMDDFVWRALRDRPKPGEKAKVLVTDNITLSSEDRRAAIKEARRAAVEDLAEVAAKTVLKMSAVIIPARKTATGLLIESVSVGWTEVVGVLRSNWSRAFEIPPQKWEELLAGAYAKAGFDDVFLTPRSGDLGRDVVAVKRGYGSIKIIGSMKAYKAGHLVKHDDVRALLGVLNAEQDASKAILTTTSDFAPRVWKDPFIKPYLPTRLELLNGEELQSWLVELANK